MEERYEQEDGCLLMREGGEGRGPEARGCESGFRFSDSL